LSILANPHLYRPVSFSMTWGSVLYSIGLHGQTMRLKGAVAPQIVGDSVAGQSTGALTLAR
jgi:hypothetical protein